MEINNRRKFNADEIDLKIIRMLISNSRMSNTEIANRLGVSEGTVRRRVKRLVDEGVIERFTISLNPKKLGYKVMAKIGVDINPSEFNKTLCYLSRLDEAFFVAIATGKHDVLMDVWVKDMDELKDFLINKVRPMLGVRNIDTSIVIEIKKCNESFHFKV